MSLSHSNNTFLDLREEDDFSIMRKTSTYVSLVTINNNTSMMDSQPAGKEDEVNTEL